MSEKLRNILLFLYCLPHVFVYQRVRSLPDGGNILVIAPGKLGDIVCTTPVFVALKSNMPKRRIYLEDRTGLNEKIIDHSNLIDGYFAFKDLASVKADVKKYNIRIAVLTGPDFKSLAYAYLSGVPFIVTPKVVGGFCPQQTKTYRLLSLLVRTVPFHFHKYAPRERLRVLEPLNIITNDTKKLLGFSKNAESFSKQLLDKNGFSQGNILVGITLSAGNKIKIWDVERFAKVIEYLHATYHNARVILVGSKNDLSLSGQLKALLHNEVKILDTTGMLSIDQLKALISRMDIFIGVDTGPIYIAEAFNIPTVDIVGPVDEREQPPIGDLHKVVVPKRSAPELYVMNARLYNKEEALRQVKAITHEEVINAVSELLKRT